MADILIIGQGGQLARALQRSCRAQGVDYHSMGSAALDLARDPEKIAESIQATKPRAVINASAYTAVDAAETDQAAAHSLNAVAPAAMVRACKALGIPFVHVSTDYVFSGTGRRPYRPTDRVNPINAYGASKAAGERAVIDCGGQATILRTSWVYDGVGKNFLTTMLRLGAERDQLTIVNDQIGRPTYAGHLAETCLKTLEVPGQTPRIFHVSDSGEPISWRDFAAAIFEASGIDCEIIGIPTTDYPTPAARPANSVMDLSAFETMFSHPLMPWRVGLAQALAERDRTL